MPEEESSMFWADQYAEQVIARIDNKKKAAVCRSGQSPSGPKHIGNICDNVRSYMVTRALNEKGQKAMHVQTHDDRDPIRKIPPKVADLDGNWKELSEKEIKALEKYRGFAYTDAPDPFGCCKSWGEHFSKLFENGCKLIGLKTEYWSHTAMYKRGDFDPYIHKALENIEKSREVIMRFQQTKDPTYIPFDAVCENCGKIIGKAVDFDVGAQTVDYVCETKSLAGEYEIKGCGHRGTTDFHGGKLPWRFEWPADWGIAHAELEPVGKEHAEGSWPSGEAIAREVYGIEPVIPLFNEFFLVNGAKMATRQGNAYIAHDIMKILEPEPFKYFYTKKPTKQRDFSVIEIFRLDDDFINSEDAYFGGSEDASERRAYETCMEPVPKAKPENVRYGVCANTIQVTNGNVDRAIEILKKTGHVKKDEERARRKLALAWTWVKNYAPEQYKFVVQEKMPSVKSIPGVREILNMAAGKIEAGADGEELQNFIYNTSKDKGVPLKEVFATAYQLILGKERGPRLGPFLASLDPDFAANRLRMLK